MSAESESVEIELDDPRSVMYNELVEMFDAEEINEILEDQLVQHLTQMYDNREQMKQEMQQRQRQRQ